MLSRCDILIMMPTDRKLKFAIFGNVYQAKKSASIQKILSILNERGANIIFDREFFDFLVNNQRLNVKADGVFENDDFDADIVISMGGDGTFLKAASHVGAKDIPVMGVNMGRLGFLADVSPAGIERAIESIYNNDFKVERHTVISVKSNGGQITEYPYALNDIAVLKRDDASMISIRASVNGEYVVTYRADGLIVSTPTGSTAYSLSNGGPIVTPQAGVLCLTPVAPHSLNVRPIVVPDNAEITVKVESRNHNFLVAVDGRSARCDESQTLTICRAPYDIKIIKRHGQTYFHTLREKMMWGVDTR